ncbi:MAG: gliding motility-associated C-terminal domain-containing protein, partial [Flavobacteriia bacterium]
SGSGANTYTWNNGVVDNVQFQIGATTTYTVTGTDINNCQNTDQITITVTPADVINAGTDFTVCENSVVTLTASGGQNPIWDNGVNDGVSFTALSTVTYTVSNTDANGCSTTDQITITVNNLPSVNAGADQFVCFGDLVTLSATGALNYVWDNNVTDSQAFLPTFGLGGVDFTVIGTDVNGCQNSDQVLVFVNDLPVVDAGLDQNVCQNSTITLSGNGAISYVWNNGVLDNIPFVIGASTTYTVTGTDANNCQNTDQVTVTITPADIINAGTDFAVCENESITLTATGGLNPIWDNNVTQGISFVPLSTAIYTVSNTDANGCTTTDQITVTINPLPNIFAGNDFNICLNDVLILSGSGGNNYVWDNNVVDGIQFSQNVGSQLYNVIGTDINGCSNSDQINVTVNPLPTIDAGTNFSVCQNSQITLSGSGAIDYVWNNGVLDNIPFNIAQTTLFTVTGTDLNGCQNSDQIQVTVLNLPNVNAGNDVEICINNTVILNGNGAVSYIWDNGISNNVSFTPLATNTFTVIGTDANGCQNSDDVLVTVNPLPNVNAGLDLTICEGDAITLSGTGAQVYVWNNGAQNNVSFIPTTNQTYTVVGTDINGCVNSDNLTLSINPIPTVSFIADLTSGCSPLNVLLTNTTPNSSNSIWTINGTEQIVAQNLNYSFLGAIDCYDISLTTTVNGCANTFSTTDFICVNPTPIALFDFTEEIINEQLSNLVFFNNTQFATQYSWDFGDNSAISNEENPIHEYFTSLLDEFNISLIATSDFGCVDSLTRTFKVREKLIYYVPNSFTPNGDELNNTFFPIFTSGFEPNSYHLTVYNRWGEVIFESLDYRVGWDGTFKNKMVEEGVYQWKIEFDTKLNQERRVLHGHVNLSL